MASKEIERRTPFRSLRHPEKFTKSLSTFLPPVLLKLESPHEPVRAKVMAICAHVSKRLKSTPELRVPVKALLGLMDVNAGRKAVVHNFALIYVEMGVARLGSEESVEVVPSLVHGISKRTVAQQQNVVSIIIPILAAYKLPKLAKGDIPRQRSPSNLNRTQMTI
ncbi:proteasome stabiliser-domain-containing protein [Chytridium lagenaria]|nr:proteasome stabiliser-domain-containing protein [Chytridium lagenaria]